MQTAGSQLGAAAMPGFLLELPRHHAPPPASSAALPATLCLNPSARKRLATALLGQQAPERCPLRALARPMPTRRYAFAGPAGPPGPSRQPASSTISALPAPGPAPANPYGFSPCSCRPVAAPTTYPHHNHAAHLGDAAARQLAPKSAANDCDRAQRQPWSMCFGCGLGESDIVLVLLAADKLKQASASTWP